VQVAGRAADGYLGHPLFTPRYFEEVVRPAVTAGAARGDRDPAGVEIAALVICSVAADEEQARREAAAQIAFYAVPSTYQKVLDVGGFASVGGRVRAAFGERDYAAMAAGVPDGLVDSAAAAGSPAQVARQLRLLGQVVDHVIVYPASFGMTAERSQQVVADVLMAGAPGQEQA
jgi:alkanesulfonate monooxygenase SsuD/methylene tetrahydromethanopterin reductase-like flavin-dependent oxidoreductase (luciferase family)